MPFKINWDNGNNACGTFPWDFATEQEATDYGNDWVTTMTGLSPELEPDQDGYSFEVIEVEAQEDTEGEGWDPAFEQHQAGLSNGEP